MELYRGGLAGVFGIIDAQALHKLMAGHYPSRCEDDKTQNSWFNRSYLRPDS